MPINILIAILKIGQSEEQYPYTQDSIMMSDPYKGISL